MANKEEDALIDLPFLKIRIPLWGTVTILGAFVLALCFSLGVIVWDMTLTRADTAITMRQRGREFSAMKARIEKIDRTDKRVSDITATIKNVQIGNAKFHVIIPKLSNTDIYVISRLAVKFEEENKFGLKAEWILAVIQQESLYNKYAISSHKCVGLMQLYPPTAERVAQHHHFTYNDLKDVQTNVQIGIWYLEDLLQKTDGNVLLSLHMYNWGENTMSKLGDNEYPFRVKSWKKKMTEGLAWKMAKS